MTNHEPCEQSGLDYGAIQALIDERFPFECNLIEVDAQTWAIHGSIPVAGEVILAEFGNRCDAEAALEMLMAAERATNAPQV